MADPYMSDAARRRQNSLMAAQTTDPAAPGLSPLEAALMAFGGPIAGAVRRAPAAAGLGFGSLAGIGGLNEAEAQQRRGPSAQVTEADRKAASVLPDALQPQYIDLVSRSRTGSLPRADREILGQLQGIIANASKGKDDAEQRRLAEAGARAEEARQRVMRDAPKTFQERFGDAASYAPIAPLAAAFATMLPTVGRGAVGANAAAAQWRKATQQGLAATDAPTLANSAALAKSFEGKFPEPSLRSSVAPYAIPAAIGGIEGAAIANIPDEWNASLPPENPERKAYEAYLKELPDTHPDYSRAKRIYDSLPLTNPARDASLAYFQDPGQVAAKTAVGALQGAGGGALATSVAKWFAPSEKSLPRAQTNALMARLKASNIDDAARAIQAESSAMGSVLPLPPARAQLPATTYAAPPPAPVPRPAPLAPPAAPPSAGYDPLAIQAQRIKNGGNAAMIAGATGLGGAAMMGEEANADGLDDFTRELMAVKALIEAYGASSPPDQFPEQPFQSAVPAPGPGVPVNRLMHYAEQ